MSLESVVSFFSILLFLFFGINVLEINRKSYANRVFFALCINNTMAAFFTMLQLSAPDLESCLFWNRFYLPFAYLSVGLIFHFHLILWKTRRNKIFFHILGFLPVAYFFLYIFSGHYFLGTYVYGPWGWYPQGTVHPMLVSVNAIILLLYGLFEILILIDLIRKARFRREKKQAVILLVALSTSFIASGIHNLLIVSHQIPFAMMPFVMHILWFTGIWFALRRYNFLGLSISLSSPDIVFRINEALLLIDPDFNILEKNSRFDEISGCSVAVSALALKNLFHEEVLQQIRSAIKGQNVPLEAFEGEWITEKQGTIPVLIRFSPVWDRFRELEGVILIIDDLRPLKAVEKISRKNAALVKEKEILLNEVHHRIKNNMFTIRSLLSLQSMASDSRELKAALSEAENRVTSMALLYDKLFCSKHFESLLFSEYCIPLIEEILGTFPPEPVVRIEKRIQDFRISSAHLFPLGIIMNEILTNCMKYAFQGRTEGIIRIETGNRRGGRAFFTLADNGIGFSEESGSGGKSSFGLDLIRGMVEYMGGTLELDASRGTSYTIELPVEEQPVNESV